ncbi:MAG: hypothetical protein HXY34_07390 [Candidatus Thorarchaeota archaeon]|nr:hypothetical protein [Candidatus Thorarchaeota archaeon]
MSFNETLAKGRMLYRSGIAALDQEVPQGFPRNAFGVIRGPGGGGKSVILNELALRLMNQGKRVVYVCLEDPPVSVLENMVSLGWDYTLLDKGLLTLVDCFSNQVLRRAEAREHTVLVRNPMEPQEITDAIYEAVRANGPNNLGGIFADSMTELFFQSHPFKAVNALKAWRATFSKELSIPFWATYHTGLQQFAAYDDMISYSSDIILDTRHEPAFMRAGVLIKQLRVTKLKGAPHVPIWVTFEVRPTGIEEMSLDDIRQIARNIVKYEFPQEE